MQDTQSLAQVQEDLLEKCDTAEWEKISLQEKWDEERAQLQQSKEQLLVEQLEVKERFNKALHSMTGVEVKTEERVP